VGFRDSGSVVRWDREADRGRGDRTVASRCGSYSRSSAAARSFKRRGALLSARRSPPSSCNGSAPPVAPCPCATAGTGGPCSILAQVDLRRLRGDAQPHARPSSRPGCSGAAGCRPGSRRSTTPPPDSRRHFICPGISAGDGLPSALSGRSFGRQPPSRRSGRFILSSGRNGSRATKAGIDPKRKRAA
jgi:hypothetical protein